MGLGTRRSFITIRVFIMDEEHYKFTYNIKTTFSLSIELLAPRLIRVPLKLWILILKCYDLTLPEASCPFTFTRVGTL